MTGLLAPPARELCLGGASSPNHVRVRPWPRRVQGTLECQRVRAGRDIRLGPWDNCPSPQACAGPRAESFVSGGSAHVLLWAPARAGTCGQRNKGAPAPHVCSVPEGALPADREVRASGKRSKPSQRNGEPLPSPSSLRTCSSAGVRGRSLPPSLQPGRTWGWRGRWEGVGRARPWGGASFLRSGAAGCPDWEPNCGLLHPQLIIVHACESANYSPRSAPTPHPPASGLQSSLTSWRTLGWPGLEILLCPLLPCTQGALKTLGKVP